MCGAVAWRGAWSLKLEVPGSSRCTCQRQNPPLTSFWRETR